MQLCEEGLQDRWTIKVKLCLLGPIVNHDVFDFSVTVLSFDPNAEQHKDQQVIDICLGGEEEEEVGVDFDIVLEVANAAEVPPQLLEEANKGEEDQLLGQHVLEVVGSFFVGDCHAVSVANRVLVVANGALNQFGLDDHFADAGAVPHRVAQARPDQLLLKLLLV